MALPKLDVPIFTVDLPLTKTKLRYRPFLVKEEKLLLIAVESDDEQTIMDSIKQIINNCCLDEIDTDSLPITDLEYFFLHLRARSIGEIVDLQYRCNNKVKNEEGQEVECGNNVKIKVNVLEIQPTFNEKHTNKIELTKNLGIVMKYPNFSLINKVKSTNDVDQILSIVTSCVDYIYDADSIYYRKDISDEELSEFIENLTQKQFAKVQEFFETVPAIKKELDFKCNKCHYEEKIVVEGIQNFFA
jgi:DNA-directed RNA polymerase subunit M/transcription elongation factor TFIIS